MKSWLIVALVSVLLASLAGIWGCCESATTPPANPMKVDLSISNAPALGETAELTCTITSHYDALNVTAEIILDSGFELVAGDLVWEGDLAVDTPIQFKATIKSIKIGNWIIQAKAGYSPYEGAYYTDGGGLYISVGEDSATVSRGRPESEVPQSEKRLESSETPSIPSSPIQVDLSISNAPALNEMAELTCTVTSSYDAPNVTAEIILDYGLELVAGDLVWKGGVIKDTPIQFRVTLKPLKLGNWVIQAKAGYSPYEGAYYTDGGGLYISVGEDSATVSRGRPESEVPQLERKLDPAEIPNFGPSLVDPLDEPPEPGPPESTPSPQHSPEEVLPGSPCTLKVTGRFLCYISEDDLPPGGEKRSDELQPTVWAAVYIYDGNDDFLGSGTTDCAGEFEIYIENPGPDVGFRVKRKPHTAACHVTKANWPWYSDYWSQTSMFYPDPEQTEYDIGTWGIPDQWDYNGAWRIYETIANDYYDRGAWDFLVNEGPGWTPPEITVRFPAGDTGYYTGSHRIHIEQLEAGMEDDYTKALDVVQHEYGHAVMHAVYNYYWPPGDCPSPHYIREESGLGCAWREGWAEFFPLAVQSYDRWDDAVWEWGTGGQQPLETPTWDTPGWDDGDEVEGRVAGALWDIYDDVPDGDDQYHGGFNDIWDTISNQNDDSFADFWDAWQSRGHNQDNAVHSIFQNTIHYYVDWDVNCDDHVNILDMTLVGQHWGETGEPHWIREDVNRDGNINVLDMNLIGQHWTG